MTRNELRSKKYNTIYDATGDSTLARQARDWGNTRITKTLENVKVDEKTRIIYVYVPVYVEVPLKEQIRPVKSKQSIIYNKARDLGYTPKEARRMRGWSSEKFEEMVEHNKIVNVDSRMERWKSMARREAYDKKLIAEAERINVESGYDETSRYGWAVVYYHYTNGGKIEEWESYLIADPFNPNIYMEANTFSF